MSTSQGSTPHPTFIAVQRIEEKLIEMKNAISHLLQELNLHGFNVNYASIIDSMAVITSQMALLQRILLPDRLPELRTYSLTPLILRAEVDPLLVKCTENRIPVFSHDHVPHLLRTKPIPEVEECELAIANVEVQSTMRQLKVVGDAVDTIEECLREARNRIDKSSRSIQISQVPDHSVTRVLVEILFHGKGLKERSSPSASKPKSESPVKQAKLPNVVTNVRSCKNYRPSSTTLSK